MENGIAANFIISLKIQRKKNTRARTHIYIITLKMFLQKNFNLIIEQIYTYI